MASWILSPISKNSVLEEFLFLVMFPLFGQLDIILRISDSKAEIREKKSSVIGEKGECGDDVVGLLERY